MFSDPIPGVLHFAIILVGCVLLLRKVAEIDGYDTLRVCVLTVIFSSPFILIGVVYVYYLVNSPTFSCGNAEIDD